MLKFSWRTQVALVGLLATLVSSSAAVSQTLNVVALNGDVTPDNNGTFGVFDVYTPGVANDGRAIFQADLQGSQGGNLDAIGIFQGDITGLTKIARSGDASPDGNGTFGLFGFNEIVVNPAGQVLFESTLFGTVNGFNDNQGIYLADTGSTVQIARRGQLVPNGNGQLRNFSTPYLNDVGHVAFVSDLSSTSGGSDDDLAIFIGDGISIVEVSREGQSIPGLSVAFTSFAENLSINDSDQVAFQADLSNGENGIFVGDGATLTAIAVSGDTLPNGTDVYDSFQGVIGITNSGDVAFQAAISTASPSGVDVTGIFFADQDGVTEIARSGDNIALHDGIFASFGSGAQAILNSQGQILFSATVDLEDGGSPLDVEALFVGGVGSMVRVVQEGDIAPDNDGTIDTILARSFNDEGHVLFRASLVGTSGGTATDEGVYVFKDFGTQTVAKKGDPILGSTITNLNVHSSLELSGRQSGINELGEVAFSFELADARTGMATWVPATPVYAQEVTVVAGTIESGDVSDLVGSDNEKFELIRKRTQVQSVIELVVKSATTTETPASLSFQLESCVLARGGITQFVELFNYDSDQFELVDTRPAIPNSDQVTRLTISSLASGYVQPGTNCVEARIRFQGQPNRNPFRVGVDQVIWETFEVRQ